MNAILAPPREHILLPYQARWYALNGDRDTEGGRYRWLEKSRQTGMTWTEALRQVMVASMPASAGGRDCTYVSTSLVLAREFMDIAAMWARAMNRHAGAYGCTLIRDGKEDILAHRIMFASGFSITGISSNPAALRGRHGDVCIDEAAHHVRLDELVKAAFACTQWGGRITLLSTHNGTRNPFNKLGEAIKSGAERGRTMRLDIYDALRGGLFKRICKLARRPWTEEGEAQFLRDCLASPGAAEEFEVNASEAGSVFYRGPLIEACGQVGDGKERRPAVCLHLQRPVDWTLKAVDARTADTRAWCDQKLRPVLKSLKRGALHYLGQDFARVRHLSAIWCLQKHDDYTLSTPFWIELRNVPDEEQQIIAEYILRGAHKGDGQPEVGVVSAKCGGFAIDTTEGGGRNLAAQLANTWTMRDDNGIGLIVPVTLNAGWYEQQHHRLRKRLEERDLTLPRDDGVTEDLQSWRISEKGGLELGPETKSKRDGLPRHGDTSIALLLAQSLAPEVPQQPKFRELRPVGRRGGRLP